MQASEILETCLYVGDLAAAESFYREVMGLDVVSRQPRRHVFFRCGQRMLLIFDPAASEADDGELPPHGARGAIHVAFAVPESSLDEWRAHLAAHGVTVERIVEWPQGGRSVYFRDPAGNSVELATPRIWGIEEATIVSSDQDRTL